MSDTDRKTVLVVDDVPENIKFTKAVLSDEYNIETAQNGEEAIENVMSDNPPDLILLDIIMPGTSGFEVLDELKSELTTR